jgi:hypothetical protein
MAILSATTELEAVNSMLGSIGQAPVNTLNVVGIKDVSVARQFLTRTLRQVQTRGWNFNTDEDYDLTPDVNGIIAIPAGALSVDAMSVGDDVTTRREPTSGIMALYNKADRTFVFPAAVPCKVIWGFPFEDLPETARNYVATAAGRRFQAQIVGSPILDRFEEEDVMSAWMMMDREERRTRDTNMFRRNARLQNIMNRSY